MTKTYSTKRIYTIVDADEDVEAYAFTDIDAYLQEWNDLMDTNYETIKQFNATETNYHIYVGRHHERQSGRHMTQDEIQKVQQALMMAEMFYLATPKGAIEGLSNPLSKVLTEAITITDKYTDE